LDASKRKNGESTDYLDIGKGAFTMSQGVFFDSTMDETERRERLYLGDNFIFSPTPASRAMVEGLRRS